MWRIDSSPYFDCIKKIGEFSIRDDLAHCESGHGYVLRMAVANCLYGLPVVKKMLGKSRFSVLNYADANLIAHWFGANPVNMRTALGNTGIGNSANDFEFCGQIFSRSYFINRTYPRVCSLCLEQESYCRNYWEISLSTACHFHGVTLLDCCPWCGEYLSWNRPQVQSCMCGGSLLLIPSAYCPASLEIEISRWIAMKLNPLANFSDNKLRGYNVCELPQSALYRLLMPLTLSGGMQLIYALGTADRSNSSLSCVMHRKKSSISSARDMLFHAESVLCKLMNSHGFDFRRSNISVIVNLLAENTKANSDDADRSLAHSLIHVLLKQGGRSNWSSRHPQLSQFQLF